MFYTKNNPDCRRAKSAFEKSATNHLTTLFCIIDMDKYEGDSRYTANINNMPRFDLYHMGNSIATFSSSNDKEIEMQIQSCERYVMMNLKNNGQSMGSQMNINPVQIQQQILNNAMMHNPPLAAQLLQNPQM